MKVQVTQDLKIGQFDCEEIVAKIKRILEDNYNSKTLHSEWNNIAEVYKGKELHGTFVLVYHPGIDARIEYQRGDFTDNLVETRGALTDEFFKECEEAITIAPQTSQNS